MDARQADHAAAVPRLSPSANSAQCAALASLRVGHTRSSPRASLLSIHFQHVSVRVLTPSSAANSAQLKPVSRQRSTRFAQSWRATRHLSCVSIPATLPWRARLRHDAVGRTDTKSAASAALNSAEGAARQTRADKPRAYAIALAECCEVCAAVEIAGALGACSPVDVNAVLSLGVRLKNVLSRLVR
jgi:four helix bundle protein